MTLRELIVALVSGLKLLVYSALYYVLVFWDWLLDLPAVYYLYGFIALGTVVYVIDQAMNMFRAFRGLPKKTKYAGQYDWGYRLGLVFRRRLERNS
jgi:hypothetical protein